MLLICCVACVVTFLYHLHHKASKTETLGLCQLPRPPDEIHKVIYLPASVKIFKNKLKNRQTDISYFHLSHQAKINNKLRQFLLSCLKAL